eukprot:18240-Heterococcus_DN1.PRE.1
MLRAVNGSSLLHIDVCLLALQQGFLPIASAAVAALESSIERTHTCDAALLDASYRCTWVLPSTRAAAAYSHSAQRTCTAAMV